MTSLLKANRRTNVAWYENSGRSRLYRRLCPLPTNIETVLNSKQTRDSIVNVSRQGSYMTFGFWPFTNFLSHSICLPATYSIMFLLQKVFSWLALPASKCVPWNVAHLGGVYVDALKEAESCSCYFSVTLSLETTTTGCCISRYTNALENGYHALAWSDRVKTIKCYNSQFVHRCKAATCYSSWHRFPVFRKQFATRSIRIFISKRRSNWKTTVSASRDSTFAKIFQEYI